MSHHGSMHDCPKDVIEYLFSNQKEISAIISSNGTKDHPHIEVLNNLQKKGARPYCTNLSPSCGERTELNYFKADIDPSLMRYLNTAIDEDSSKVQNACQGDILIQIDNNGKLIVVPEFDHQCLFDGGLNHLFKQ